MIPDPKCMSSDELAFWLEAHRVVLVRDPNAATDPCADCTVGFAAEMQAQDRCNGIPGLTRKRREPGPDPGWRERNRVDYFRRVLRDKGLPVSHAERVG